MRERPAPAGLLLAGVLLAGVVLAGPACADFPWKAGDAPPTVAGVTLGQTRAEVIATLGPPARVEVLQAPDTVVQLHWPKRGIAVVVTRLDGAAIVTLTRADAGTLDGIKVGDSLDAVIARWGMPAQRVEGDGVWRVGDWDVIVHPAAAKPVVTTLTLGWDTSKFALAAVVKAEKATGRMQLHPLPSSRP